VIYVEEVDDSVKRNRTDSRRDGDKDSRRIAYEIMMITKSASRRRDDSRDRSYRRTDLLKTDTVEKAGRLLESDVTIEGRKVTDHGDAYILRTTGERKACLIGDRGVYDLYEERANYTSEVVLVYSLKACRWYMNEIAISVIALLCGSYCARVQAAGCNSHACNLFPQVEGTSTSSPLLLGRNSYRICCRIWPVSQWTVHVGSPSKA